MQSSNIRYMPQVDHLRGVAALWIVLYHGLHMVGSVLTTGKLGPTHFVSNNPLMGAFIEGHSAVSLFMVLSGFIFTYGALDRTVMYGAYLKNRLLRIYPLYITTIFIAIAASSESFVLETFLSTVLPLADYQRLTGAFVAMSWAVAVEFQFYLIFPFLLSFVNRSPARTICGLIACALLFRILAVDLGASARDISYRHITGRIDQFLLGMGSAVLLRRADIRAGLLKVNLVVGIVLVFSLLFAFHRLGGWHAETFWKVLWPTVEGFSYSLLIIGYVGTRDVLPSAASRALTWVGERSFSIYLLHFPIVEIVLRHKIFIRATGNDVLDGLATAVVVVLPTVLAVATLTYGVIEKPFLALRVRYLVEAPVAKVRSLAA